LTVVAQQYRRASLEDVAGMAEVRAGDWGSEEFWRERIAKYLAGESHPQRALAPRVAFVCVDAERVVGLIAGHLTRRFNCAGELQWISVRPEFRGRGIASQLFLLLADWFAAQGALRVCVDVEPSNATARRFYAGHGAVDLKPSWMVWADIRKPSESGSQGEDMANS
jgi:ribosomal protein S18 acetylase RimI-like enzyme